jgi:S-adenosylmethionine-diacylglycerol 3-amino-3-carboxypropyl transferase
MREGWVDWCSQKWFSMIHGNKLVYNACWEDPRIDRVALDLGPEDRLLTITSAGCNTLDYALLGPKHIYAVDINPRQSALLELKIAGIRELDFETFFQIFGQGRHEDFVFVYTQYLRHHLSAASAAHWDRHLDYFESKGGRSGFYFRGASGALARWINHYIDFNQLRDPVQAIFDADTVAEQNYIYRSLLQKRFWSDLIRWFLQWDAPYAFIGVPRAQRKQVEETYRGGMRQFIEDCFETVFARLPLKDNYFWWLYVSGQYLPHRCPEYLKEENFLALKGGLVERISVHTASLADFMRSLRERISRFVLLDHMDWLWGSLRGVLQEEWQLFTEIAAPQARLLWRSASTHCQFVDKVEVSVGGRHCRVGDLLRYHAALAAELQTRDRVHTYGSFAIADLQLA